MERSNKSFGAMYKEAEQFRELQSGLHELIELSRVPVKDKLRGSGMASAHYYRCLQERKFNAKQLLGIMRSVIENTNYEMVKNKNSGHITPSL
ncbi:MAG: hypothetical protein K0M40_22695 [Prolixibacteraceae bacterium]|nr:hypothetical protein [Prolixibacteraceae bacterium]